MEFTLKLRAQHIIKSIMGQIQQGTRMLDIGCGNGVVSDEISKVLGCEIHATDIVNYLRRPLPFKLMPGTTRLDYDDGEFELGLMNDMIHHVQSADQMPLIREAMRVCKKLIIFDAEPSRIGFFFDLVLNRIHNKDMPVPLTNRPQMEWVSQLSGLGYVCVANKLAKPFPFYPFDNFILFVNR